MDDKLVHKKICCESSCDSIYDPDADGKCPKCGSDGIWMSKTVLGIKDFITQGCVDRKNNKI